MDTNKHQEREKNSIKEKYRVEEKGGFTICILQMKR